MILMILILIVIMILILISIDIDNAIGIDADNGINVNNDKSKRYLVGTLSVYTIFSLQKQTLYEAHFDLDLTKVKNNLRNNNSILALCCIRSGAWCFN